MVSKETLLNQDAAAAEPRSEPRSEKAPNSSETMKKHLFFCKAQVPSGVIKLNLAGNSLRNGTISSQPLFDCQRLSHNFRPKNPCQLRRSELLRFKTTRMMGLQPKFWIVSNPSTSGSYNHIPGSYPLVEVSFFHRLQPLFWRGQPVSWGMLSTSCVASASFPFTKQLRRWDWVERRQRAVVNVYEKNIYTSIYIYTRHVIYMTYRAYIYSIMHV